ncbi:MAG: hypothetical protein RLZZ628_1266 [Bacteroidota bacterium]|jgi:hypothetical protein
MKKIFYLLLISCVLQTAAAQKRYSTGLDFDDDAHTKTLVKNPSKNRGLLLSKTSLKAYCPTPQQQGDYPNCVGWAIGYAACTISEAVSKNIQDRKLVDAMATSPMYVYAHAKPKKDTECNSNAKMDDALTNLKLVSAIPRLQQFNEICTPPKDLPKNFSEGIRITDFVSLFKESDSKQQKLYLIKQALSNRKPVVAAIKVYDSMKNAKKIWSGDLAHYTGGHAVCFVGYNDDLEGGTVEMMNSWGTDWGDKGFTLIRYKDLDTILKYAFELTVDKCVALKDAPAPLPTDNKDNSLITNLLSSSIELQLAAGTVMPIETFQKKKETARSVEPNYKTVQGYSVGTKYRILMEHSEPIYLYVLASDLTGHVSKIFPADETMSAQLSNPNAPLILPNEAWHIELDDTKGKDYLIFIYAKKEQSIETLLAQWNAQQGEPLEKIYKTYTSKIQSFTTNNVVQNKMSFQAKLNSENIILLTLEMEHL